MTHSLSWFSSRPSVGLAAVLAVFSLVGCSADEVTVASTTAPEVELPEGWSEASHGDDVPANYDVVFPRDQVQRLDIVISADDFASMMADLDEVVSASGGGPGSPPDGPPTQEAFDACEGLSEGDSCEYLSSGTTVTGDCRMDPMQNRLVCVEGGSGEGGASSDPIYVPATLQYDERFWPHVGIRYKGNSSLRYSYTDGIRKLPFRLEIDQFEDDYPTTKDQRFYGFKELTFAPGYYDPSYLHDALALEILEGHGVPAAARAFWSIHVDVGDGAGPTYWGLYTMIEDPSDEMMETHFGDESGNLYKPEQNCADLTCFNEATFVKKSNETAADFGDVQALVSALEADQSDAAAWRSGLEAVFDVDGFLRWLAINTAIVGWDSYGLAPHNYYLYGVPAEDGRLSWIPWDNNMTLANYKMGSLSLELDEVTDEWPLIRLVLDDPIYAATYRQEVALAVTGPFALQTFSDRAQQLHDLIAPYVQSESAPYTQLESFTSFEQSVDGTDGLIDHVTERHDAVSAFLAQ